MERIRDMYSGEIIIPLPELSQPRPSSVPNLVAQGIEQIAIVITQFEIEPNV